MSAQRRLRHIQGAVGHSCHVHVIDDCGAARSVKPEVEIDHLAAGWRYGAEAFLVLYAAHSALAHIQIGLCSLVGYRAPERYLYPIAAVSPREFWERWNVYVTTWLSNLHLRSFVAPLQTSAHGLGSGNSRTCMHWYHARCLYVSDPRRNDLARIRWLHFWGALVVSWRFIEKFERSCERPLSRRVLRETSRIAFLSTLFVSVWVFL